MRKTTVITMVIRHFYQLTPLTAWAEEFGQNYLRSAATSVDKSENSPQFFYIILR